MWTRQTAKLSATIIALIVACISSAHAQYDNDDLKAQIDGLGVAHNLAYPGSLVPIPGSTLVFGNTTYATNLGLKYVPPVLVPPDPLRVSPNVNECEYLFTIEGEETKTRDDFLGLLTQYEQDFDWGVLGSPEVYHVHTDVEVGVYGGENPLDDPRPLSGMVKLKVGEQYLRWQGQTLVTPILDYPPWHVILATIVQANARRAMFGLKAPGPREKAAIALTELFIELGMEGVSAGTNWFDSARTPTKSPDGDLIINNQFQPVWIYDHTPPVFTEVGSTARTVEATQVGGEFLRDHIEDLKRGFTVSDACNRIPNVTYSAPPFLPLGQTTQILWTASDAGPAFPDGGSNRTEFVQTVTVQDALPPILLPPPGRVIESDVSQSVNVGNAAVFDLADVRPLVTNDAPTSFSPDTRTRLTWSATDASGNATTATQWITLKTPGTNTAPQAASQSIVAKTFEPVEIELTGSDADFLSGRFDQLAFSIAQQPQNGFFVAPLLPYFIEDHRVENAFGLTRTELKNLLDSECFADPDNYVPPVDFVNSPRYITVDDEGIAYVSDEFYICRSTSATIESTPRISRFVKNSDGELEYDRHLQLPDSLKLESLSIDTDGVIYYIVPAAGTSIGHVTGCDSLLVSANCTIYRLGTNPTSVAEDRLLDDPTSVVVDASNGVMYATDGGVSLIAYDLLNVDSVERPAYLGRVADPGELESGGANRKDLAIDSDGNLYLSDSALDRVYKFTTSTIERQEDGSVSFTAGEFVGWMGRCATNLTETRACDEVGERSYGYSCIAATCGLTIVNSAPVTSGEEPGQFDQPEGIAIDANGVLYVTDHKNFRVQRFTPDGFFAGEAISECNGSCFVLGDFGRPEDVSVNLQFFYVLDQERDLLHVFETTPITDFDDDTLQTTQTARVTYQSDEGFTGVDTFSFAVSDGLAKSNMADVSVSVTRNFRAPIATEGQVFTTDEDVPLDFTITAFDPDSDDQPILTYSIEEQPAHGMIVGAGPDFTYTPNPDFFGADEFMFSVSDGVDVSTATARIDVAPVNDAPVITLGRMEDAYGAGFDLTLEALITDVDLTDQHVYGIQWNSGPIVDVLSGTALPPGESPAPGEPTFVQSADGTGLLVANIRYFDYGVQTITVCATDVPGITSLPSCTHPSVNATASKVVTIEPRVSKQVIITDNRSTSTAELGVEVPDPVVDGTPFNTVFTVHNLVPAGIDVPLDATDVRLSAQLASGLTIGQAGVTAISGDAVNPVCTSNSRTLQCTADSLPVGGQMNVNVEMVGDGSITANADVPVVAMAASGELDHNGMIGNARSYQLTMNPAGDSDGDGVPNGQDSFPGDPFESSDFDLDGIGDNADLDDDNDSLPDRWESRFGYDPLNASDGMFDDDLDSLTNAEEFALGTRPDSEDTDLDRVADAIDNCPVLVNHRQFDLDVDTIGDACDEDTYAAVAVLADIGGDPVYALVRTDNGQHTAYLKSATSNMPVGAGSIDLGTVAGRSIISIAGSGDRLVALAHSVSGVQVQSIDVNTGGTAFETTVFDNALRPVTMVAAGDELWVAAEGSAEVRRVAANDGSVLGAVTFDASLVPIGFAQPTAASMLLLGTNDATGDIVTEIRAVSDSSLIASITVGDSEVIRAAVSATESGFAVLTQSKNGSGVVSTWSADGTAGSSFSVFDTNWTLVDIDTLPVWSGSGDAVAVTGISSTGDIHIRVFDAANGMEISQREFASTSDSLRAVTVAAVGPMSTLGALIADAENSVSIEIQDAEGSNANARTLTAESNQPPPAPPPPPPPPSSGGGGSLGYVLLFGLLLISRRRWRPHLPRLLI